MRCVNLVPAFDKLSVLIVTVLHYTPHDRIQNINENVGKISYIEPEQHAATLGEHAE